MRFVFFAVTGAVACAAFLNPFAASVHAQDTGGATVIRSESRLVLVDAVAVDKKGKFARDLAQKDFRVWEDGKEQKVTSFSLESSGVTPERPSKHYIVLYFDTSTIGQGGELSVRTQATRFVDGFGSPDRYMAVLSYAAAGGLRVNQNFTTESDRLKKAMNTLQGTAGGTPTMTTTAPARGGRGAPPPSSTTTADPYVMHELLSSLRGVAKSMATIRGRKALVLFSAGSEVTGENSSDMLTTIEALNKANVAVYAVGGGSGAALTENSGVSAPSTAGRRGAGAGPPVETGGSDLAAVNQSIGYSLAEGTGGLTFVSTNDLAESLGKVAQEQDEYYLLGYTPAIESAEGSCHELKVKVDRGDLEVRARKGYCTSKPVDLLSGKPAGLELETKAATGAPANIAAQMQLPWFYSAPNVARIDLAMDIDTASIKFRKEKGKYHSEFDLAGVAYKPDGSVAARVSDAVKLDFDNQQQVEAFLHSPYHYENQFEIAPGQYNFKMAFSSGDQGFGKAELPVKVDPWNGQGLSASAIALSRDVHAAADLAAGLDESLLEGARPLVAKGAEVVPTGTNRFHAGERAFFYLEAYEPLLSAIPAGKADAPLPPLGVRVRILDRATGQQKDDSGIKVATSFMRAGNPVVPIISALPITNLPAGQYTLEVTVMRQSGEPVVRTADFDLN